MLPWYAYLAHFVGGAVLANSVPHLANGVSGRPFPTPFARPRGIGNSTPVANILWGFANLVVGYVLIELWTALPPRRDGDLAAIFAGALLAAVLLARHFGRQRGDR